MSRTLHRITLHITLQAPYLVHGNDAGRFGLDATLLVDHLGRPILPGTLLAGRVAEVWRAHGAALGQPDADDWFGRGTTPENPNPPRARLQLADLVLTRINDQDAADPHALTTTESARTALDDATGSVQRGALLITEQISDAGAALHFEGHWHAWANTAEATRLAQQLHAALLLQTQLGAYRGVGFGRLRNVQVTVQSVPAQPELALTAGTRLRLGLQFDAPLCVNTTSRRGNVFVSGDVIPGGTLLGALAQTLMQQHGAQRLADVRNSALAQHFNALRCTHALPSAPGAGRPMPLPMSLVAIDNVVLDAYSTGAAGHFDVAPAFQVDWKPGTFAAACQCQGWAQTGRRLRVRTAIQNGKAADGQLFAYDCIYAAPDAPVQWQCNLDLSAVPAGAQATVRQELASLLRHGLGPIGKTDARAQVTCIAQPREVWHTQLGGKPLSRGQQVPLVLVSDALLFATPAVADQPSPDLAAIYRSAFDDLAAQAGHPGALSFSHFFATQQLRGGPGFDHLYLKPRQRAYQPLVLTQAGSVFVFEVADPAPAQALLQHWQDHGLPLPGPVSQHHGATWQDHPYIPQNGYGEVVVQAALPFRPL